MIFRKNINFTFIISNILLRVFSSLSFFCKILLKWSWNKFSFSWLCSFFLICIRYQLIDNHVVRSLFDQRFDLAHFFDRWLIDPLSSLTRFRRIFKWSAGIVSVEENVFSISTCLHATRTNSTRSKFCSSITSEYRWKRTSSQAIELQYHSNIQLVSKSSRKDIIQFPTTLIISLSFSASNEKTTENHCEQQSCCFISSSISNDVLLSTSQLFMQLQQSFSFVLLLFIALCICTRTDLYTTDVCSYSGWLWRIDWIVLLNK